MGSTVTIVGIALCAVVIVVVLVFVILQRTHFRGKIKYMTTSAGGSPNLFPLPMTRSDTHLNSRHSSCDLQLHRKRRHSFSHVDPTAVGLAALTISQHSSSNASSPGDGIYPDMEKPLTRKSRRDKSMAKNGMSGKMKKSKRCEKKTLKVPKSQPSRISDACNQSVKFFKSTVAGGRDKGDIEKMSPKPSTREYMSVKGPCGIEIVDNDDTPVPRRILSPRSPHAYSRQKNSPDSTSPTATKTDILKKRYEMNSEKSPSHPSSDLERVVTGSSGDSSSSKSKTSTTRAQVNWSQPGFVRAALHEVGKSFSDRNKKINQRPPSEEIPLIDSNSQESPSHAINIMIKSDSSDSSATGLARLRTSTARRPTSLTESYSSDYTPTTPKAKVPFPTFSDLPPNPVENTPKSEVGTLNKNESFRPRPTPTPTSNLTPTSRLPNFPTLPAPSPSLSRSPRIQRLQQQHQNEQSKQQYQQLYQPKHHEHAQHQKDQTQSQIENASPILSHKNPSHKNIAVYENKDMKDNLAGVEEREVLLPKPDGQSPRLPRAETPNLGAHRSKRHELSSPGKLSKCSSRGSKTTISSPAHSINTPSEIDGLELEYDDFIEDDPLSYFDYEMTQKLAFRGTERIGKTVEEEDEDDIS